MSDFSKELVTFVRNQFATSDFIPLHSPRFEGKEKEYLLDTIDSTFVSTVGAYVNQFEEKVSQYTGAKYAIATVNGTSALHAAMIVSGVKPKDSAASSTNLILYCSHKSLIL